MKALRHIGIFLAVALALTGCGVSKVKDIFVNSVSLKYLAPTSSRSMDAVLLLEIDNPSITVTLSDIDGMVYYYEKPLVQFSAGPLPLEGKSVQTYELPCSVALAPEASLLDLLVVAAGKSMDELKADVQANATLKKGTRVPLKFKRVHLAAFTRNL